MFVRRIIPAFTCLVLLTFSGLSATAQQSTLQNRSATGLQFVAPSTKIKPIPSIITPAPQRIDPSRGQGATAPAKPPVAMPKVVTPVPGTAAPSSRTPNRPGPLQTNGTGGTLAYKYVCQARREWCYVNASKPIPSETMCFCGDLEGKTVAMK